MRNFRLLIGMCGLAGAALAATTNTTLNITLNCPAPTGLTVTCTGPASLTGIGSGTASATLNIGQIGGQTIVMPYKITLSDGTLSGNLSVPVTGLQDGATYSGSATVASGTGNYGGDVGNFANLSGNTTGSFGTQFTTKVTGSGTITSGGTPPPTITAVLDAGGYTSGIARGSIFVIKGTGLSAAGFTQSGFPLPGNFSGVTITLKNDVTGSSTNAYIIYLYNQGGVNQLAALLPSAVTEGSYSLTVTNTANATSPTSAPFSVTVLKNKPGIITQDSTGNGLAVVQNYVSATELDINRFTTGSVSGIPISPAHPGQTLIAWATGLGPISAPDNQGAPFDNSFTPNVAAWVGGRKIAAAFGGRAPGLAGEDQVDFVLPSDIATGCAISFQVSIGDTMSQSTFISIAPVGATECSQPGFTTQQLKDFDNGSSVNVGSFNISQSSESSPFGNSGGTSIDGSFTKITGFELPAISPYYLSQTLPQGCTVFPQNSNNNPVQAFGVGIGLDAGTVTLNGPSGSGASSLALSEDDSKNYSANLTALTGGTYTLTGGGGTDVGSFSTSASLGNAFSLTGGLPSTVNRSAGLTLHWTGGGSSDIVTILGASIQVVNSTSSGAYFVCYTTAGAGSFTVPASILNQLPAISSSALSSGAGEGTISVTWTTYPVMFSPPLKAGGNISSYLTLSTEVGTTGITYQ